MAYSRLSGRLMRFTAVAGGWMFLASVALAYMPTKLVTTLPFARAKEHQVTHAAAPGLSSDLRLGHFTVLDKLRAEGIGWRSNGNCDDREETDCTSFEGMRWSSLLGLIDFHRQSGCPITVSGGTERGHADGLYTHYNGYKIDIMPNRCIDAYVKQHYRYAGERGDGADLYKAPNGYTYVDEFGTHWDIVFSAAWRPTYHEQSG